jgi:uncharacterized surface protein with fasciclin (FAS1) repeats
MKGIVMKRLAFALALAASASACGGSSKPASTTTTEAAATTDIVDTATAAGSFKTLLAAVEAGGLVETLKGPGPFTVFAPTDEAFAKLPPGTVDALLADKTKLVAVLTYHVVAGNVSSAQVTGMTEATTVQGGMIKIDTASGVKINNATVIKADVAASNGVIHVIDTVLLPPE